MVSRTEVSLKTPNHGPRVLVVAMATHETILLGVRTVAVGEDTIVGSGRERLALVWTMIGCASPLAGVDLREGVCVNRTPHAGQDRLPVKARQRMRRYGQQCRCEKDEWAPHDAQSLPGTAPLNPIQCKTWIPASRLRWGVSSKTVEPLPSCARCYILWSAFLCG